MGMMQHLGLRGMFQSLIAIVSMLSLYESVARCDLVAVDALKINVAYQRW
jgi:hypothetical protein